MSAKKPVGAAQRHYLSDAMPKNAEIVRRHRWDSYALLAVFLAVLMTGSQAWAGSVRGPVTATIVAANGTVMKAPTNKKITTAEGVWTFGATANPNGDYPLLLNGSAANGGLAVSLQLTNGNLYAFAKADGKYWCRFKGAWVNVGSTSPVHGIVATKVTLDWKRVTIRDDLPAGTVLATVTVTMSPPGASFSGALVSSDPMFAFQGMHVVLARALTKADDGLHKTRITALE
jgi:hypothetical protein